MDEGLSKTGRRVVGYALRWGDAALINQRTGPFTETFRRGAFAKSIARKQVNLCLDHNRSAVLASQADGTLTLIEDAIGLRIDAVIADTLDGEDAIATVRQRSKAGLSVSFGSPVCDHRESEGIRTRTVTDCDLIEVSVCREPAYRSSEIVAGSMRIERFLKAIDPAAERERRLSEAEANIAQWRAAKSVHEVRSPPAKSAADFIEADNAFWLMWG